MPTIIYRDPDTNKRVPSVTTILSNLGWSKDGLMRWAWQQGINGEDFDQIRGKAAVIGTYAHTLVERDIDGQPLYPLPDTKLKEDEVAQALSAYEAYKRWEREKRMRILATETNMVSPTLKYGGTPDAVGFVEPAEEPSELCMFDWKTSNAIHPEYVLQLAAYLVLWEEVTGMPLTGGVYCLRFGKHHGAFSEHHWPREVLVDVAFPVFDMLRQIHNKRQVLKNLAGV